MRLYPRYEVPAKGVSPARYLRSLVNRGALLRWESPLSLEIRGRLDEELKCAEAKDACEYLLLVADMVKATKKADVVFGPGRGVATHSAVCYALGITDVDPIRYQLEPTHFLCATSCFPDIDFETDSRGRLFARDYLIQKYGESHVAHLMWKGRDFHPTVLVLSSQPIAEVVPAVVVKTRGSKDERKEVVQANVTAEQAETAGLLRLDFVSAPWLTLIRRTLADVLVNARGMGQHTGNAYADSLLTTSTAKINAFVQNIPLDDPEALKLLYLGDAAGVYFYSDPQVAAFVLGEYWETFDDMLSYYLDMRRTVFKPKYRCSRGHHIAFALMAYRTAWVKAYFRREFDEQYRLMLAESWKFE